MQQKDNVCQGRGRLIISFRKNLHYHMLILVQVRSKGGVLPLEQKICGCSVVLFLLGRVHCTGSDQQLQNICLLPQQHTVPEERFYQWWCPRRSMRQSQMDRRRKRKLGSLTSGVLCAFYLPLVTIAVSTLDCFQTRRLCQSYSDCLLAVSYYILLCSYILQSHKVEEQLA